MRFCGKGQLNEEWHCFSPVLLSVFPCSFVCSSHVHVQLQNKISFLFLFVGCEIVRIFMLFFVVFFSHYKDICAHLTPWDRAGCPRVLERHKVPCSCPFQPGLYTLPRLKIPIPRMDGVLEMLAKVRLLLFEISCWNSFFSSHFPFFGQRLLIKEPCLTFLWDKLFGIFCSIFVVRFVLVWFVLLCFFFFCFFVFFFFLFFCFVLFFFVL